VKHLGIFEEAIRKLLGSSLPKSGSALLDFGSSLRGQRFLMGRERVFAPRSELPDFGNLLLERTRSERDSRLERGGGGGGASGNPGPHT
jgi:hypothetical protein